MFYVEKFNYKDRCPKFYCSKCIVHHIRFCPVNLLLISWRALGSLDASSGGTTVFLGTEPVVCENLLVFIRRCTKPDLPDVCDALTSRGGCAEAVSSIAVLFLSCVSLCGSVFFLFFSLVSLFIRLFSKREYSSTRYSENRFPPTSLECPNTWPHTHDMRKSALDLLHAMQRSTTMVKLYIEATETGD